MKPIVKISNLTYYYPNEKEPVLKDINLEIYPGEFVLLIGPSGCGKSTLALCMNGIIPNIYGGRIKGNVFVDGLNTMETTVYDLGTRIGVVFQDPDSQLCNLYVEEEVAFGPGNLMMDRNEILNRVNSSLKFVEESEIRNKFVYEISGGQKQRVAIASILAMKPNIIILDEPTSNLDPLGVVKFFDLIKKINVENKITMIVIEHNVDSVMCHADRLLLMDDGKIIYDDFPRKLLKGRGRYIMDNLGIRIPQVSELGLIMEENGIELDPFPLTVDETAESISLIREQISFSEKKVKKLKDKEEQEIVIKADNLNFTYPDGTHAVKDISLKINKGDIISIIGKNGSGKTTLASLFIGLKHPTSGNCEVYDIDVTHANIRELASKIGYVFQYPEHQFVANSVYNEVAFSLRAKKIPKDEVNEKVDYVLELMRLDKFKEKHPFKLSMGQKRRLSVATMLILDTDILILDEPTTGQDKYNIDNIMSIMMKANQKGTTVIIITHDMNLVSRYCNKILVMDDGKNVFFDSKTNFCKKFNQIESDYLVLPEIYKLANILREEKGFNVPEVFTIDDFLNTVKVKKWLD